MPYSKNERNAQNSYLYLDKPLRLVWWVGRQDKQANSKSLYKVICTGERCLLGRDREGSLPAIAIIHQLCTSNSATDTEEAVVMENVILNTHARARTHQPLPLVQTVLSPGTNVSHSHISLTSSLKCHHLTEAFSGHSS